MYLPAISTFCPVMYCDVYLSTFILYHPFQYTLPTCTIDRIEYDVTVQIFALQDGICERVRVRACGVEIKPGVLRVSLMYAFGRAYGLTYKMATFIAAKGLFNKVNKLILHWQGN